MARVASAQEAAIVPATLAAGTGVRVKRRGDQQWGPDQS